MVYPSPPPPPQYAIWKIIVGGLLCTVGLGGVTFRFQLNSILRDMQRKQQGHLDHDIVQILRDVATVALYCGLVMIPLGLILILTAKKKPKPQS
jgi:hypothetical protein